MLRINNFDLRGSIVALVTPMNPAGRIIFEDFEQLIEWHIDQGSQGLVIAGTTGESATVSTAEHCQLIDLAVKTAAGRIPIIAGAGSNSTREQIDLVLEANRSKADACLLVVPYYNKPSQQGLYAHFFAAAQLCDIPLILYNVPDRCGCDIVPETVAKLADLPQIVGIKEATGDMERYRQLRKLCGDDFLIYSGDDATATELMLLGGDGVISVTANVVPALVKQLCDAALGKNKSRTLETATQIKALNEALFLESNPIPVKYALFKMKKIRAGLRLPLQNLNEKFQPQLDQILQSMDLLAETETFPG